MGQPKSTAEYIQATSRVGRQHPGPGAHRLQLGPVARPVPLRDLLSYHRALYRQVEPTSATPFSPRARDRGLHGCLLATPRNTSRSWPRQRGGAVPDKDPDFVGARRSAGILTGPRGRADRGAATGHQHRPTDRGMVEAASKETLKYPGLARRHRRPPRSSGQHPE